MAHGRLRQSPDQAGAAACGDGRGDVAERDVFVDRGRLAQRHRGVGRGYLGRDLRQVPVALVLRSVGAVDEDRHADVGHPEVLVGDVRQVSPAVAVRLDADPAFGAVKDAVADGEVGDASAGIASDGDAVAGAVTAIADQHVRGVLAAGIVVVADADVAVGHQDVAAADVAGVGVVAGVGRILGGGRPDGDFRDGDFLATDRDVEHRGVTQRHAFDQDAFAVMEPDHARAFLRLVLGERPPVGALAFDGPGAGDG